MQATKRIHSLAKDSREYQQKGRRNLPRLPRLPYSAGFNLWKLGVAGDRRLVTEGSPGLLERGEACPADTHQPESYRAATLQVPL